MIASYGVGRMVIALLLIGLMLGLAAVPNRTQAQSVPPETIEALFQQALSSLRQGETGDAIRTLRAILALDPDLPRVRLELARAYFMAEDWRLSRQTFLEALSGDLPVEVRRTVLGFLREIDARRGWSWDLSLGFRPNLFNSRRYHTDRIDVRTPLGVLPFTVERDEPAPLVVEIDASAERRSEPIGSIGKATVIGFVDGAVAAAQAAGTTDDDLQIASRAGVRLVSEAWTLHAAATGLARHADADWNEDRFGLAIGFDHRTAEGATSMGEAQASIVDHHQTDDRDGTFLRVHGIRAQSFGGRGLVGASVAVSRFQAESDIESFTEIGFRAFGSVDIGGGFTAETAVQWERQEFDDQPDYLLHERVDREISVSLRVRKLDIFLFGAFSPYVDLAAIRRRSTIDAYGYDEGIISVGLERTI